MAVERDITKNDLGRWNTTMVQNTCKHQQFGIRAQEVYLTNFSLNCSLKYLIWCSISWQIQIFHSLKSVYWQTNHFFHQFSIIMAKRDWLISYTDRRLLRFSFCNVNRLCNNRHNTFWMHNREMLVADTKGDIFC